MSGLAYQLLVVDDSTPDTSLLQRCLEQAKDAPSARLRQRLDAHRE